MGRTPLQDPEGFEKLGVSLGEEASGELHLVVFPIFASTFLPKLLRHYANSHPSVSIYCDEI